MANKPTTIKNKYCGECGQKNYRPHRSIKELVVEFAEDWLGYDSKIYQTSKALLKPASLSKDYFANSHHKNHYITPIRLYLLLTIIFFVMTQFGGLNITHVKVDLTEEVNTEVAKLTDDPSHTDETQDVNNKNEFAEKKYYKENEGVNININSNEADFNSNSGCKNNPEDILNLWPHWLDDAIDLRVSELCEEYGNISYLPNAKQPQAKIQFGLSLGQNAIEVIPQTLFFGLPLLAGLLGLFYMFSKRLYVEHLVVLMHSHSFIFSVVLLYLGWFKLTIALPALDIIPMGILMSIGCIIYLFLTQKWFYERGFWSTLWRFLLFGLIYTIIINLLILVALLVGLMAN